MALKLRGARATVLYECDRRMAAPLAGDEEIEPADGGLRDDRSRSPPARPI